MLEVDVIFGNRWFSGWPISRSPSWSVGLPTHYEAMDVAWSAPKGAHYHADVIYLLPLLDIEKGAKELMILRVKPTSTVCVTLVHSKPLLSIPIIRYP